MARTRASVVKRNGRSVELDSGHSSVIEPSAVTPANGPGSILALQRKAGNRATAELLRRGQARLEVGPVDDPYEREADMVAARVGAALGSRSSSAQSPKVRSAARRRSAVPAGDAATVASRRSAPVGPGGGTVAADTESAINSARGGGTPLPGDLRAGLEGAFGGADFSTVRLHSGPGATGLNRALSAEAFTVGSDIFFRDGIPDRSRAGNELLAHELAHTIQQGGAGVNRKVAQRLFGKKNKKPKTDVPQIDPFLAQAVSRAIPEQPEWQEYEQLKREGDEKKADKVLEDFWNRKVIRVKDKDDKNAYVRLAEFKPLMFTPSEKRMIKIKKWRMAIAVKNMWDEGVRRGEVKDPHPERQQEQDEVEDSLSDKSGAVDTVTGIVGGVGYANTTGDLGAKLGDKIELHQAAKLKPPQPSMTVDQDIQKEWKSLTDTNSVSSPSDSNYEAKQWSNKSEWADGMMGIIGQAVTLVSSVTSTISLALSKKATKADVAAQVQDNLAQAASTADKILQALEHIKGSEITSHMFHWVPGLSVFSSGFSAIGSLVSLVQKSYRLFKFNSGRKKTTEKEEEDLSLAMDRLWVRAAQQVEQDVFTTAKNLTNAGLALAEVVTAGGFGIPKLAQGVLTAVSTVHSLGHAIADSGRAAATKSARTGYFGAHLKGSAEKLIRTDPLAAAEAIISRAAEGDDKARELLDAYAIDVPGITSPLSDTQNGLTAPTEKDKTKVVKVNGKDRHQLEDILFSYSPVDVAKYEFAVGKLMSGLKESDQPQTIWDKVKDGVKSALQTPGKIADRFRQAKRIADTRNELEYGGRTDRRTGWVVKQAIFGGDSGVKKLSESTSKMVLESYGKFKTESDNANRGRAPSKRFLGVQKGDKRGATVRDTGTRDRLLEALRPESILRAKREQSKADAERPVLDIIHLTGDKKLVYDIAMSVSFSELKSVVDAGPVNAGLSADEWDAVVAALVVRTPNEVPAPKQEQLSTVGS